VGDVLRCRRGPPRDLPDRVHRTSPRTIRWSYLNLHPWLRVEPWRFIRRRQIRGLGRRRGRPSSSTPAHSRACFRHNTTAGSPIRRLRRTTVSAHPWATRPHPRSHRSVQKPTATTCTGRPARRNPLTPAQAQRRPETGDTTTRERSRTGLATKIPPRTRTQSRSSARQQTRDPPQARLWPTLLMGRVCSSGPSATGRIRTPLTSPKGSRGGSPSRRIPRWRSGRATRDDRRDHLVANAIAPRDATEE
jgi:hypothetical protein